MKTLIARYLRRAAAKLDPPATPTPFYIADQTTTSANAGCKITYR